MFVSQNPNIQLSFTIVMIVKNVKIIFHLWIQMANNLS